MWSVFVWVKRTEWYDLWIFGTSSSKDTYTTCEHTNCIKGVFAFIYSFLHVFFILELLLRYWTYFLFLFWHHHPRHITWNKFILFHFKAFIIHITFTNISFESISQLVSVIKFHFHQRERGLFFQQKELLNKHRKLALLFPTKKQSKIIRIYKEAWQRQHQIPITTQQFLPLLLTLLKVLQLEYQW